MVVLRPGDANETAAAWKVALERKNGPTGIILSRQNMPTLSPPTAAVANGAYILIDSPNPKVVLMASGSEVSIVAEAHSLLAKEVC